MNTLHQVMIEALARAVSPQVNIYARDAYTIIARKLQKLIDVKGPNCPVSEVSIQDVESINIISTYV